MKFNPDTYDPGNDSTPGALAKRATKEKTFIRKIDLVGKGDDERYTCECGCGDTPKGKNAQFMMGHDARLKGALTRAHLSNTPVVIIRVGEEGSFTAAEIADDYGWQKWLKKAEQRFERQPKPKAKKPTGAASTNGALSKGAQVRIKVGRWNHDGQVVRVLNQGGEYEVEYKNKKGEPRTARLQAANVQAAV